MVGPRGGKTIAPFPIRPVTSVSRTISLSSTSSTVVPRSLDTFTVRESGSGVWAEGSDNSASEIGSP